MTANSQLRGHPIYWDGHLWRYCDDHEPTESSWHDRPCARCGQMETPEGHDPCIANLPGVINACCGHGNPDEAYVMFEDGRCMRGIKQFEEAPE